MDFSMDFIEIIKIVVLMLSVFGICIFLLYRALVSSTEGAVNRLNEEIAKTNRKQAELTQKLREADDELNKRRKEARELAEKMHTEVDDECRTQKEKIMNEAQAQSEEIITKAQNAGEKLKEEIKNELNMLAVDYGVKILNRVFSQKTKESFNTELINEFIHQLKDTDMSNVRTDEGIEVVTTVNIDDSLKSQFVQIINGKLNADVDVKNTVDESLGAGVVLKFGSMVIDGSVKSLLEEESIQIKKEIEEKV